MLYGHRKDVEGFAKSLEEFDGLLDRFLQLLGESDLLMITADHGCDPDLRWETTDHSREYVPILAYSPGNGAGRESWYARNARGHGTDDRGEFWRRNSPRKEFFGRSHSKVRAMSATMLFDRPVAALAERAGLRRSIAHACPLRCNL